MNRIPAAHVEQRAVRGAYRTLEALLKRRRQPNQHSEATWRTSGAEAPDALAVRRRVIEQDLWSGKNWRRHRVRMREAAREFDAALARQAARRVAGRPKRGAMSTPLN